MTNDASRNEIVAYERTPEGMLYNRARYATGGRGSGGVTDPLESQGSLTLSQDRSLLFAVNAGSGTVSVFTVHGAFLFLRDRAASGGSEPVAVAQWRDLVYVLNQGGSGSVVAFRLEAGGRLRQIRNSTVFLTANATGGSSLSISPDGRFLTVVERLANKIDAFQIKSDGTLAHIVANSSPGAGAFSAIFAPEGNLLVSETGVAGVMNGSAASSYAITQDGMLSAFTQSIPTLGAANCWNAVTPDGRWVYFSNAGSATIAGFAIGKTGQLTPIGGTIVGTNPEGSTNLDIAITANGRYLYTLNSGTGTIGIFKIQQDGTLLSLGEAGELPANSGLNGIAAL
jgi:6-phosphogluconolactonase (cycloisomerase 2 family)